MAAPPEDPRDRHSYLTGLSGIPWFPPSSVYWSLGRDFTYQPL